MPVIYHAPTNDACICRSRTELGRDIADTRMQAFVAALQRLGQSRADVQMFNNFVNGVHPPDALDVFLYARSMVVGQRLLDSLNAKVNTSVCWHAAALLCGAFVACVGCVWVV